MRGKKRPLSERTRAVGIALVDGVPQAAAATGIPDRTIYEWRDSDEFAELRERTREAVADEWWAIVQMGFRRVAHLLTDTDDLQKGAIATAIIADKMLLIRGEATTRSETRTWTDSLDDTEKQRLRDWIDTLDGPAGTGQPGEASTDPAEVGAALR